MNNACNKLVAILLAAVSLPAAADDWFFREEIIRQPVPERFSVCFNHSCRTIVTRSVSRQEWQGVSEPLQTPAATPLAERAAIARSIARMEQIVGQKTGTDGDKGGNLAGFGQQKQMDCIDESNNTTTYLKLLQQDGLLKHHEVGNRATRFGLFAGMPHTTAVIEEIAAKRRYAVDAWFFDNGQPPVIVPLDEWKSGWRPAGGRDE